jgi:NADH-quinone oxidoreductase subunit H
VAGFHTEYSGLRWSFFFMAEYASMFAVSGIATLLFLGGWHIGGPWDLYQSLGWVGNLINVVVFILKSWVLVFVMMWVRWTLPRLRIDQVMMTCLKYLLPISCFLLLGVSLWQVLVMPFVGIWFPVAMTVVCLLLLVLAIGKIFTTPSDLRTPGVDTPWGPIGSPGARVRKV